MKQVYLAGDLADAYIARGRLWAAGIHAIIRGRDVSAMRGLQVSQDPLPSLWVDDGNGDRAQQILGGPPHDQ